MKEQWQELKETIIELRDNDGTGTQQEVCKFLVNYMGVLEKQIQEPCDDEITLKVKRGALKSRQGDMVIYNVAWLREHWQMEMDIVCGVKPCDDAISRQAVFNAIEREDKWLLAAKGHNELTEMAFSGLKARIDALLPVTQKSVLEQITAEIYEHFMTIDGNVHDKSAIKCMEIIGKYKGDKE